ncbi:SecY subunit domain-containing protein [Scenedesmus sp. NREL 46B-D3]|nr:SecY subunit domain-containing protein [Scenedesmus sp. NREL 46B-D3]
MRAASSKSPISSGRLQRVASRLLTTSSSSSSRPYLGSSSRRSRLVYVHATEPDTDTAAQPKVPDTPPSKDSNGSSSNGNSLLSSVSRANTPSSTRSSAASSLEEDGFSWGSFLSGPLPGKLAALIGLIVVSRVGVYVRIPGVDVDAFSSAMQSNGLLGYVDALSGGSISKVGLFSLGIIPYINASIVLQLMSAAFPALKKMQREDGPQGRARFQYYQKLAAFVFAIAQAVGQLTYIRPYVTDFSPEWLFSSSMALVAGALGLIYVADTISELKLGNGTSVLIFANIASSLPSSVGALLSQNAESNPGNVAIYGVAFFLTTLGIIYVQEAERRIPVNYSSRCVPGGNLARQSYLPFKVNATGVMPLIFASSLLGLPLALARLTDSAGLERAAEALGPGGSLYLPVNVALIAFFNYYYTFLQLEPKDLSEQLKRTGAAIPGIRPGKQTAEYVASTLTRMSLLGSLFLAGLSLAPAAVEGITHLSAFRGFAGTSVLIMVGVATDTARRIRAEQAMAKYQDVDKLYQDMDAKP